jgi:hypothetical protein
LIDVLTPRGWDRALCYVADLSNPSVRELSEDKLLSRLMTA